MELKVADWRGVPYVTDLGNVFELVMSWKQGREVDGRKDSKQRS